MPLPRRNGIIAGGNWIVDHIKLLDNWPEQDALTSILGECSSNGGSPYNILKALARLGASFPLEAVGLVGDDANGSAILADCRQHGIDTHQLRVSQEGATSYTDVMTVKSSGRRTFFHHRGASGLLHDGQFDFLATPAKIFHLGYLLLLDQLDLPDAAGTPRAAAVLAAARRAGLKTSIDLVSESSNRFQRVILPVLPQVDCLFANDFEAEKLTSLSLRTNGKIQPSAVETAAGRLLQDGVNEVVVLHFPEAVYACTSSGLNCWQPSVCVPASEIKGAAGAGDALAAGVLYGLHEEWPIPECLRLGVCVAATSLYHPTCSDGIPSLPAALALGRKLGYRSLP